MSHFPNCQSVFPRTSMCSSDASLCLVSDNGDLNGYTHLWKHGHKYVPLELCGGGGYFRSEMSATGFSCEPLVLGGVTVLGVRRQVPARESRLLGVGLWGYAIPSHFWSCSLSLLSREVNSFPCHTFLPPWWCHALCMRLWMELSKVVGWNKSFLDKLYLEGVFVTATQSD